MNMNLHIFTVWDHNPSVVVLRRPQLIRFNQKPLQKRSNSINHRVRDNFRHIVRWWSCCSLKLWLVSLKAGEPKGNQSSSTKQSWEILCHIYDISVWEKNKTSLIPSLSLTGRNLLTALWHCPTSWLNKLKQKYQQLELFLSAQRIRWWAFPENLSEAMTVRNETTFFDQWNERTTIVPLLPMAAKGSQEVQQSRRQWVHFFDHLHWFINHFKF